MKNNLKMTRKIHLNSKGFTLAEVLITLGIIGIIAAMTLPTLVNKYQERITVTKVKKFYSLMNQVLQHAITDNGSIDQWSYIKEGANAPDVSSLGKSSSAFASKFKPYLKISKDCGDNTGCIAKQFYYLNGNRYNVDYDGSKRYYKMILTDGLTLWIRDNYNPSLPNQTECELTDAGVNNICGVLWLDTNGKNPPNKFGVDVFCFYIMKNRILPHALDDCKSSQNGWGCSTYILQKGDMKYYYK